MGDPSVVASRYLSRSPHPTDVSTPRHGGHRQLSQSYRTPATSSPRRGDLEPLSQSLSETQRRLREAAEANLSELADFPDLSSLIAASSPHHRSPAPRPKSGRRDDRPTPSSSPARSPLPQRHATAPLPQSHPAPPPETGRLNWALSDLAEARRRISELEGQLEAAEGERAAADRRAVTNEARVTELEAKVQKIVTLGAVDAEERRRLDEQAADARRQQSAAEALVVEEERRRRGEAERELLALQRRNDELELRAETSDAQLRSEAEAAVRQVDQLSRDLEQARLDAAQRTAALERVEAAEATAAEHANRAEHLGSKLAAADSEVQSLRAELEAVQRQLDSAEEEIQAARKESAHDRQSVEELQQQLARLSAQEEAAGRDLIVARDEVATLQARCDVLQVEADRCSSLQEELTNAKRETLRALEAQAACQVDLDQTREEAEAATKASSVQLGAHAATINDAIQTAQQAIDREGEALRKLEAYQRQMEVTQAELDRAKTTAAAVASAAAEQEQLRTAQYTDACAEVTRLEEELKIARDAAAEDTQTAVSTLQASHSSAQRALVEEHQKELDRLGEALIAAQQGMESLKANQAEELRSAVSAHADEVDRYSTSLQQAQEALATLQSAHTDALCKLEACQEEVRSLNETVINRENEISVAQEAVHQAQSEAQRTASTHAAEIAELRRQLQMTQDNAEEALAANTSHIERLQSRIQELNTALDTTDVDAEVHRKFNEVVHSERARCAAVLPSDSPLATVAMQSGPIAAIEGLLAETSAKAEASEQEIAKMLAALKLAEGESEALQTMVDEWNVQLGLCRKVIPEGSEAARLLFDDGVAACVDMLLQRLGQAEKAAAEHEQEIASKGTEQATRMNAVVEENAALRQELDAIRSKVQDNALTRKNSNMDASEETRSPTNGLLRGDDVRHDEPFEERGDIADEHTRQKAVRPTPFDILDQPNQSSPVVVEVSSECASPVRKEPPLEAPSSQLPSETTARDRAMTRSNAVRPATPNALKVDDPVVKEQTRSSTTALASAVSLESRLIDPATLVAALEEVDGMSVITQPSGEGSGDLNVPEADSSGGSQPGSGATTWPRRKPRGRDVKGDRRKTSLLSLDHSGNWSEVDATPMTSPRPHGSDQALSWERPHAGWWEHAKEKYHKDTTHHAARTSWLPHEVSSNMTKTQLMRLGVMDAFALQQKEKPSPPRHQSSISTASTMEVGELVRRRSSLPFLRESVGTSPTGENDSAAPRAQDHASKMPLDTNTRNWPEIHPVVATLLAFLVALVAYVWHSILFGLEK